MCGWLKSRFLRTRGQRGVCRDVQRLVGPVRLSRDRTSSLLVVSPEPGAEFHESCHGIASGGWQGHVGL